MKPVRDRLSLGFACSENWDAMPGDAKGRHCASCDQRVHDIAAMTDAELQIALDHGAGRICARVAGLAIAAMVTMIEPAAAQSHAWPVACEAAPESKTVIEGTVVDAIGGRIANAEIRVVRVEDRKETRCRATDGKFRIGLPPGKYDVSIHESGFRSFQQKAIDLRKKSARIDVTLEVGFIGEVVEVKPNRR